MTHIHPSGMTSPAHPGSSPFRQHSSQKRVWQRHKTPILSCRQRLHQCDMNQYAKQFHLSKKEFMSNHLWPSSLFLTVTSFWPPDVVPLCTLVSDARGQGNGNKDSLFYWTNKHRFVKWGVRQVHWKFRSVGVEASPENQTSYACLLPISLWLMHTDFVLHRSTSHSLTLYPQAGSGGRLQKIYGTHNG